MTIMTIMRKTTRGVGSGGKGVRGIRDGGGEEEKNRWVFGGGDDWFDSTITTIIRDKDDIRYEINHL